MVKVVENMRIPKIGSKAPVIALIGILIVAIGLRVWGISFGLPYRYHYDEPYYVNTALHLGQGVLNNPPYNPTGLSNLLFPQYAAYYFIGNLAGVFSSPSQFEAAFRHDPSAFQLAGRLTIAIFGAATTLALFLLARAATNREIVGLIAAGLLAVSFLHVRDSHYAVPDIAMTFFVTIATALAAMGLREGRKRKIYLAGLAGGIAIAMKWTSAFVVIPVLWVAICQGQTTRNSALEKLINPITLLAGIALVLGFSLGSPQLLINPKPYIDHLRGIQSTAQQISSSPTLYAAYSRWEFYWRTLQYGVGLVLMGLGIAGALRRFVLALKARDPMSLLVLSFPLIYILIIGNSGYKFARYLLPIIPFLAFFAAEMIVVLWEKMRATRKRLGGSLSGLLVVAAIVPPLVTSIRHDVILTRTDTRTLAKQWIEFNIPEGSKIAADWPIYGPPLSTLDATVPYSTRVFDVLYVGGDGLFSHPLRWYQEQGFEYLITSSYISKNVAYGWNDPARQEFYNSLEESFVLVQAFRHYQGDLEPAFLFLDEIYGPTTGLWKRLRPGPTIKIYKIQT